MANKVIKVVSKIDSDYIEIVRNEFELNKTFLRTQLFTNNYFKHQIKRYIDLNEKCGPNLDFSKYYEKRKSYDTFSFVCKDCKQREYNELNIFKHISQHFSEFSNYNNTNCGNPLTDSETDDDMNSNDNHIRDNVRKPMVTHNEDNEWQVLDEWQPMNGNQKSNTNDNNNGLDSCDNNSISEDSTNCSEALRRLSSYSESELSSDAGLPLNGDNSRGEPKSKRHKKDSESDQQIYSCKWFECNKKFAHKKCFETHFDKHLIDLNGNKWDLKDYSFGYFTYDGIQDYIEIIEENNREKYFCKYQDCSYHSLWSYQLVIHIRSEHTSLWPPFLCDWNECHKIVSSKEAFAHRITHYLPNNSSQKLP